MQYPSRHRIPARAPRLARLGTLVYRDRFGRIAAADMKPDALVHSVAPGRVQSLAAIDYCIAKSSLSRMAEGAVESIRGVRVAVSATRGSKALAGRNVGASLM